VKCGFVTDVYCAWCAGPKDDDSKTDMSGDEPVPTVNGTLRQRGGTPRHR